MLTIRLKDVSYNITVQQDSLQTCGEWLSKLWSPRKVAIITDEIVGELYADGVAQRLAIHGFQPTILTVPCGEQSKSIETAEKLYEELIKYQFSRSDSIVALGGGVIGDLAGFVASTYLRGLAFVQMPTSLLAQVDSSIGGKTAVNVGSAKNMVGTFYQPDSVLIDPAVLKTLTTKHISAGFAEIIKSAAIADVDLWQKLEKYNDLTAAMNEIEAIILATLKVKQSFVEADVYDNGQRMILNFGHTIGHAIELAPSKEAYLHGEAVAIGMLQLTKHMEKKGLTKGGTTSKLKQLLVKFGLPTTMNYLFATEHESVYQAILHDKKIKGDKIHLIVIKDIAQPAIIEVPITELKDYLL